MGLAACTRVVAYQGGYGFGRKHSCGSSCSCGPARCSLVFELVRMMVRSIEVISYVQDVGRLTDEVVRATSSGYVRGSRAASFSMVHLVARASSCLSHSSYSCGPVRCSLVLELVWTMVRSIGVTSYVQDIDRLAD